MRINTVYEARTYPAVGYMWKVQIRYHWLGFWKDIADTHGRTRIMTQSQASDLVRKLVREGIKQGPKL